MITEISQLPYRKLQSVLKIFKQQNLVSISLNSSRQKLISELTKIASGLTKIKRLPISRMVEIINDKDFLMAELAPFDQDGSYPALVDEKIFFTEKRQIFLEVFDQFLRNVSEVVDLINQCETGSELLSCGSVLLAENIDILKLYVTGKLDLDIIESFACGMCLTKNKEFLLPDYSLVDWDSADAELEKRDRCSLLYFHFNYLFYDLNSLFMKLDEFGLIENDLQIKVTDKQMLNWVLDKVNNGTSTGSSSVSDTEELIIEALNTNQPQYAVKLGFGTKPPSLPKTWWTEKIETLINDTLNATHKTFGWGFDVPNVDWFGKIKNEAKHWGVKNPLIDTIKELTTPDERSMEVLKFAYEGHDPFLIEKRNVTVRDGIRQVNLSPDRSLSKLTYDEKHLHQKAIKSWLTDNIARVGEQVLNEFLKLYHTSVSWLMELCNPLVSGDCWTVLQVAPENTVGEIKKAYRALMKKFHPDTSDHPRAKEYSQKITEAYRECLMNHDSDEWKKLV